MPLSSGTRLGPYEIIEPLGAGGMGEVYRARDSKLGRDVAIKVLPTALANDTGYLARFQREAQVLAALNHPNIAAIYGLEENAIVMELVEGSDLRGPLPLDAALELARQIVEALGAAHEKGIVHRDLKPANIKITPEGSVKVLDFGLAKGVEQGPAPGDPEDSPTVTFGGTKAGTIIGTAAYMAPEQARGQVVDRRADIWAFGAVLYEMLTGRRVFSGGSISDVLAAVLTKEPDWSALPPATTAWVRELLRVCLAKDRKLRLQAIGDARIFLRTPVDDAASVVAIPWRPVLPWALAILLAITAAMALWIAWRAPRTVADRPLLQLDLDTASDDASQVAISPDGMRVVFVSGDHLAVRRLDEAKITPLAGTGAATYPFFSPDGQWVAFFGAGKLQKISLEGGAPVVVCDAPNGRGGSWGDDGNIVAALSRTGGLSRVSASGGTPRLLGNWNEEGATEVASRWPQVLPGSKGVLFTATSGLSQSSLQVMNTNSGKPKTLVANSTHGRLAGGYLVYYQHGTLFAARMDVGRLELTSPAVPLVDGVSSTSIAGRADFDLSRSGTLVYRRSIETNRIPSWLYSSEKVERLQLKPGSYRTPRLSWDGRRLALAMTQESQQNLWVYDLGRETLTRLTFDSVAEFSPIWTPDGEFLAFCSADTLAWMRSDGSGKVERLAAANRTAYPWSFSADGKWLAFSQRDPTTGFNLWIAAVERTPGTLRLGQPQPLVEHSGSQHFGVISPDSRWLAYMSDESGRFEIYVVPFLPQGPARGGKWQVSNGGGLNPVWSRQGRELFYGSLDHRIMVAGYTGKGDLFEAEKPRFWSEMRLPDTGTSPFFDVAPDGKRVVTLLDAEDAKPGTHLRVLLNVDNELHRRTSAGASSSGK